MWKKCYGNVDFRSIVRVIIRTCLPEQVLFLSAIRIEQTIRQNDERLKSFRIKKCDSLQERTSVCALHLLSKR